MTATNMKRKKVSKKNKSSWRKHTDIRDVEEFLEDQRTEERIGSFSLKKDEDLFTIDTEKSEKIILSNKDKRKLTAGRDPKNTTSLINTSKVVDPHGQRDKVKLKKNGRDIEDEVINPTTQKHVQANKDRQKYYEKLDNEVAQKRNKVAKVFKKDIWEEADGLKKYPKFNNNQWISRELALHHLKNTGRIVKKLHDTAHHATSKLKAFEKPHPGMSYNPSLSDHQNLLKKVIEKEIEIVKREKHLKRVTIDMFSKMSEKERDSEILKEQASGLPAKDVWIEGNNDNDDTHSSKDDDEDDDDDNEPYTSVNLPVENKKKLRKARRKAKEQREIKQKIQEKKLEKKKITDILRIQNLKEEVVEIEENVNEAKKRRKSLRKKKKFEPKRLCKIQFEETEIDVNQAQDIHGNLRNVKPESSLLVDRFKNFQKRNILAATVDVGTHKRRKVKRFIRNSHKDVPRDHVV